MITKKNPPPNKDPATPNVIKSHQSKHPPVGQQNSLNPSQPKFQINDLANHLISIHNES